MKVETLGCPYCGEIQMVEVSDTATTEGMRAAIVRNCTCQGARREISMQDLTERLDVLWGDGCERLLNARPARTKGTKWRWWPGGFGTDFWRALGWSRRTATCA